MALKVYDTLRRALVPFEPIVPDRALVYGCGPTIYGDAHIGNFRAFLFFDLVHRYLEWIGYDVRFVMNLTDVDDKTINGAVSAGQDIRSYTEPFGESFLNTCTTLGVRPADSYPRATEYVDRMISFIEILIERRHAYQAEDGAVYFSISTFADYGKLKGIDPSTLRAGARVAQDEYDKEDARDFVLWKKATPEDESASAAWNSPWGRGRPGWHLECSVMSTTELGPTLDMHLGGEDLVFPHHENEIAQSEAATGEPFVRHWLHVKHLLVEGKKMSKSLGNFIVVRDLIDEGYDPASIRHQLMSAQYRRELNFTRAGLDGSRSAVQRLLDFEARLDATDTDPNAGHTHLPELAHDLTARFRRALDDDFNSADGMGVLFTFVNRVNNALDAQSVVRPEELNATRRALGGVDQVLGLLEVAHASRAVDDDLAQWVEGRIEARADARASRNFAAADSIRDELAERGIVLEDGASGTRWKVQA